MKKWLLIIISLLAFVLVLAGCATTSDTDKTAEAEGIAEKKQTVAPVSTSTSDLISSISSPSDAVSEPAGEPATSVAPVELKKKSIEDLFDETTNWPDNVHSLPVLMKPAEDSINWMTFYDMANADASAEELEEYLRDWWGEYGWTPEFYVACHNYYFIKASDLLDEAASDEDIQAVYACFDRCFASALRGAMQYPDRLDLWCGFIYAANMMGDYANAEQVCELIFDRLYVNGNKWYWTFNTPFYEEDDVERENEFTGIMHDYICEWLDSDIGLPYATPVSELLVKCFPENSVALNDLALCRIYSGNIEEAAEYLERAYAADPDDIVVIGNLAYAYEELGNLDAAAFFANLMIQSGDREYVDMGIQLLAEIYEMKADKADEQ